MILLEIQKELIDYKRSENININYTKGKYVDTFYGRHTSLTPANKDKLLRKWTLRAMNRHNTDIKKYKGKCYFFTVILQT